MKLSVIMPTYNYGRLLPDTLRSLAAQTFTDFELLVVDDGSTDNTEEVVRGFSSQLRNCIYVKKPHTGPADSRKFALQTVTGTHIASLDSDDLWSPDYVAAVRSSFESHPGGELLFCDGLHVQDTGAVLRAVFPSTPPACSGQIRSARELFMLAINFCPTGMVFLKSLYDRVGPFDVRYGFGLCDDTDWVVRALIAGAYCIRIDRKLFVHRIHGSNLTTDPVAYLEPWLGVFDEKIKGSALGPEFERYGREFSRDYVLRLLGICSPAKGRGLLSQTLKVLPGDFLLTSAYASTYVGSTFALKVLKFGKRLLRKMFRENQRLDLSAHPSVMFEGVK
jgi:glycosyltransferase involved in cell wall biosynthesis